MLEGYGYPKQEAKRQEPQQNANFHSRQSSVESLLAQVTILPATQQRVAKPKQTDNQFLEHRHHDFQDGNVFSRQKDKVRGHHKKKDTATFLQEEVKAPATTDREGL